MERQFPKNVRQVGNVCDTPKIYVEDYVDTYLNQLKERAEEQPVGAFLVGEILTIDEQECVRITGAVGMQDLNSEAAEITVTDEIYEKAQAECAEYFGGSSLVGWFLVVPGKPLGINGNIVRIHEKLFQKKHSIFIMMDATDHEELYFAYKYQELMQMGGHYIFYEKNPAMQNYMINTRRQIGVTPSEVVADRAAKNFRSTMKEKIQVQEQKSNARFAYVTSALLVVVVLAIGISTMNNYDKMNAVQSSIETLSKAVDGPKKAEAGDVKETEVQEQPQEPEQPQGTEEQPQTQEETVAPETQNASGQTEPVTSTIQEELSEDNYYVVQKGDTLDKISLKIYGTTTEVDGICKMNGLTDGNLIFIGQRLLLP